MQFSPDQPDFPELYEEGMMLLSLTRALYGHILIASTLSSLSLLNILTEK